MSLAEVVGGIRRFLQDHEDLETPGNCRTTARELLRVAPDFDKSPPHVIILILSAHPGEAGVNNHYALLVKDDDKALLINPVPAPGYPQYIGDLQTAPPLFPTLQVVDDIV